MVPIPSVVNTSSSKACGTRPSRTCARLTPPSTARRQASILGTMPLASDGSSALSSSARMLLTTSPARRPVGVQALDIGQDDQFLRGERDRDRRRRGVRIDVVGQPVASSRDRGDDRDASRIEQRSHRAGIDRDHVTDLADVDRLAVDDRRTPFGRQQPGILPDKPTAKGP